MARKISAALLATLFLFSLFAIPVIALDKKADPIERAPVYKHNFPTHMTIEEAEEYEAQVGDREAFAEAVQETGFTPGIPGSAGILGTSDYFNGILAGYSMYDYQKNGTCQRQIQAGINPGDGVRLVHVSWMCLKVDIVTDPSRQVNYNCYDWAASPNPKWTLSGDDYGGISIIEANERGGYTCTEVNSGGNAVVFHHSAIEGASNYARVARFAIPRLGTYIGDKLTDYAGKQCIWARGGISRSTAPNGDIYHVVAQQSEPTGQSPSSVIYWRYIYDGGLGEFVWQGPVLMDSSMTLSHLCMADGDRVVYVLTKPRTYGTAQNQYNNDLGYYQSSTAGADWIANGGPTTGWAAGGGFNCTDYVDADPHRAYIDVTAGFDSQGRLHLMYNNPAYDDEAGTISVGPTRMLHWDEGTPGSNEKAYPSPGPGLGFVGGSEVNFHLAAAAEWVCDGSAGAWNRYISKMCMGFGDGSTNCDFGPNLDYVYCVYTQFGSNDPLDIEDVSASGMQNGNLFMSISNDLGFSWAAGKCITTTDGTVGGTPTRTPDCDITADPADSCKSEHWSSIATLITDTLHCFYVGDKDAGGIPQGEGNWAVNEMVYLPIFGGGDPNPLCPTIAPNLIVGLTSDPNCEYYSDDDEPTNDETLTIENIGNASLNYSAAIAYTSGSGWMEFVGYGQTIPGSVIPKGGTADEYTVRMSGGGLANGLYQAEIQVTNDDPTKDNPFVLEINFFRADSFVCGEGVVVTTPCVALEVSNVESWGRENGEGGMWYYNESDDDSLFNPVYDGSLVIKDVNVDESSYRDVFTNSTPYNPGYRALETPKISYNAATNDSLVSANQVTVDSVLGVTVNYLFPQETENCEFVRLKFKIYERDGLSRDLIVGAAVDFDVDPTGNEDLGGWVEDYNLVYQHGFDDDTLTYLPDTVAVSNNYAAGITALTCDPVRRMVVQSNAAYVYGSGGLDDEYVHEQMDSVGHGIWIDFGGQDDEDDYVDDVHSLIAIDATPTTVGPDQAAVYQMALVSSIAATTDITAETYYNERGATDAYITDLLATTAKAWKKGFGWCGDFWLTGGSLVIDGGDGSFSVTDRLILPG